MSAIICIMLLIFGYIDRNPLLAIAAGLFAIAAEMASKKGGQDE